MGWLVRSPVRESERVTDEVVDALLDRRSSRIGTDGRWRIGAFLPMIHGMTPVMQILDGDRDSLELRVTRALAALGDTVTVSRFTVWYTSRPPVHGAVLRRPAAVPDEPTA